LDYESLTQENSTRTIQPLQLEFWGNVWTCTAWCEVREDFRVFRVDRIVRCKLVDQKFGGEPGKSLATYLKLFQQSS